MKFWKLPFLPLLFLAGMCALGLYVWGVLNENRQLQKVIERLTASSRIAKVMVTNVATDPASGKTLTTISFQEFDTKNKPLPVRYFTFTGNLIQFQSIIIRFDDYYVKKGDALRGKSAYVFLKAFCLQGKETEQYDINKIGEVPSGYVVTGVTPSFQRKLWKQFWLYALDPYAAKSAGVKNAQIEAPGTKFLPGFAYTVLIEHAGGMRIEAQPL